MTPRPDITYPLPYGLSWQHGEDERYGASMGLTVAYDGSWWHGWALEREDGTWAVALDNPKGETFRAVDIPHTFTTEDKALQYISAMLCLGEYGE